MSTESNSTAASLIGGAAAAAAASHRRPAGRQRRNQAGVVDDAINDANDVRHTHTHTHRHRQTKRPPRPASIGEREKRAVLTSQQWRRRFAALVEIRAAIAAAKIDDCALVRKRGSSINRLARLQAGGDQSEGSLIRLSFINTKLAAAAAAAADRWAAKTSHQYSNERHQQSSSSSCCYGCGLLMKRPRAERGGGFVCIRTVVLPFSPCLPSFVYLSLAYQ